MPRITCRKQKRALLVLGCPARYALTVALLIATALFVSACARHDSANSTTPAAASGIREESVRFSSGDITLAGTLVLPANAAPHPAVVLFHGSGPNQRDLSMARWFAEQGVAALAYDKRGTGESTGDFRAVPFMELANDGLAAIAYSKGRTEIDRKRIGVWGLSQGGWLGPLAASRSTDVAFVIAVSGPGVSPGEQMIVYYANELEDQGMAAADVREATKLRREIWTYMETGSGYEKAKADLAEAREKKWFSAAKAQQDRSFDKLPTPAELDTPAGRNARWFRKEAVYDPVPALRALRVPTLFVFGDRDRLIPVPESIAIIKDVQKESPGHDFTIREFPYDDHGMFLVAGDGSGELDPEYLRTMREWLGAHVFRH